MDRSDLANDGFQWKALVSAAVNLRVLLLES
jgi:hypothetical protein